MKPSIALAACAVGLFVHARSLAADIPQRLAVCAPCHGVDGHSTMLGSPSLAALPAVFLETQLVLIREGVRPVAQKGNAGGDARRRARRNRPVLRAAPLRLAPAGREESKFLRGKAIAERALSRHLPSPALPAAAAGTASGRAAGRLPAPVDAAVQVQSGERSRHYLAAALHGITEDERVDLAHYLAFVR